MQEKFTERLYHEIDLEALEKDGGTKKTVLFF